MTMLFKLWPLLLFLYLPELSGQIPDDFQQLTESFSVILLSDPEAPDSWEIRKSPLNNFAKDEYRLFTKEFDVYFIFLPAEKMKLPYPHLEFNRQVTHLSSNNEDSYTYYYSVTPPAGTDWAGEARFSPKSRVSGKNYALARAIYKEEKGMIICLYLDSKLKPDYPDVMAFLVDN